MSVNIQTPNGLVNISGDKVTKKKVISALGYTPANEEHTHDMSSYYTKSEVGTKINESNQYVLGEVDKKLAEGYYTQGQTDDKIATACDNVLKEVDEKITDRTGKVVIIEPSSTFNSNAFKVSDARLIYDEYVKGNTVIVKGTTSYYVISYVGVFTNEIAIVSSMGYEYIQHRYDITNDEYDNTSVTRFTLGYLSRSNHNHDDKYAAKDHTHDEFYTKEETDQKITDAATGGTVDLSNYYTKEETDALIPEDEVVYIEYEDSSLDELVSSQTIKGSILRQIVETYDNGKHPVLRVYDSRGRDVGITIDLYPTVCREKGTNYQGTAYTNTYIVIPVFVASVRDYKVILSVPFDDSSTEDDSYYGVTARHLADKNVKDLTNYYKKTEVYTQSETDTKISEAIENIDIPETDLSDYYNKTEIDNKLEEKADANHNHDSTYALAEHTHDEYAVIDHKHDSEYAPKDHNHNESYSPIGHVHEDLATIEYVDAEIENKADATHKHDGTTTSYGYDIVQSSNISNTNEDCTYGFIYDSTLDGLTPNNKGVNKSFAYAKLSFTMPEYGSLTLSVNQSSEKNYDYGWVSKLDMDLPKDYETTTEDSSVKYNAKGLDGAATITFDHVSKGTHYITIRYRKDSSSASGDDTFTITSLTANYKVDAYATENRIYDILDAYMTANYENGDTGSY